MMGVMTVMAEHLHSFQSTGNRAALSNQFFAADESLTARRSTVMASFAAPS
jgi:N-dimethylarginine dimethylaminohydrolase